MPTIEDLAPLFSPDLVISVDDADAIVAALRDVARSDGEHEEELRMIEGFVEMLDADLGEEKPTELEEMSPKKLAATVVDPTLRTVAVQACILLAWADGAVSDKERECIIGYADALGVESDRYEQLEKTITDWVRSGDFSLMF